VRLKQIYYLSKGNVIPVSVSISHGKAVAALDMGADDSVTWWALELDSAGGSGRNGHYYWDGLRLCTARTAAPSERRLSDLLALLPRVWP
jgi:hypothetical protein